MADISLTAKRKRPTSITVMGILGIIFSSLALLGSLGGLFQLAVFSSIKSSLSALGADTGEFSYIVPMMRDFLNLFIALFAIHTILGIISGGLGLSGTIGLLADKSWSRPLTIAYALIRLLSAVAMVVVLFLLIDPLLQSLEKLFRDSSIFTDYSPNPQKAGAVFIAFYGAFMKIIIVVSALLESVLPILFLVFLNTKKAKEHFARLKNPAIVA